MVMSTLTLAKGSHLFKRLVNGIQQSVQIYLPDTLESQASSDYSVTPQGQVVGRRGEMMLPTPETPHQRFHAIVQRITGGDPTVGNTLASTYSIKIPLEYLEAQYGLTQRIIPGAYVSIDSPDSGNIISVERNPGEDAKLKQKMLKIVSVTRDDLAMICKIVAEDVEVASSFGQEGIA